MKRALISLTVLTLIPAAALSQDTVRYALEKYPMHSCRDNFLYALATDPIFNQLGMNKRDLPSNINFFMNVPVTEAGNLEFVDGLSAPGKYVEMRAEMDVIVLISNCPQLNNPCNAYHPTPIRLLVWDPLHHSEMTNNVLITKVKADV